MNFEYLDKKEFIVNYKKSLVRFEIHQPEKFIIQEYNSRLNASNIELTQIKGKCIICGKETSFKNIMTAHYICSNECKSKDNKQISEVEHEL